MSDARELGEVVALQIAPAKGERLVAVAEVEALAGRGLVGDHHLKKVGRHTGKLGSGRDVTLIESEALEALEREHGIALAPLESRRNVVTRGVRLNDLVGRDFLVGAVVLRGVRLCEPCSRLVKLSGRSVIRGLSGRGGLNATVVSGGRLRVGDPVRPRALVLFEEGPGHETLPRA